MANVGCKDLVTFFLLIAFPCVARSDTQTFTWKGGVGNWTTSSSWSVSGPSNAAENVYKVDGGNAAASVVTVNTSPTASRLEVSAGDQAVVPLGQTLFLKSGLNVDGKITLRGNVVLPNAGEGLLGAGEVYFDGAANLPTVMCMGTAAAPFIIGADLRVHAGQGKFAVYDPSPLVINQNGIVDADVSSAFFSMGGFQLNNAGSLVASAGYFSVDSTNILNTGTISASGTGIVVLNGNWINQGAFDLQNGGTLNLDGTFAEIGTLRRSGINTVNISGILDRSALGTPLRLDATTGSMGLKDGTIRNTTLVFAEGATLVPAAFSNNDNVLENATIASDWSIPTGGYVRTQKNLKLDNARISLQPGSQVALDDFKGAQTVNGTGEFVFPVGGSSGAHLSIGVRGVTLGPGITVHGGDGQINLGSNTSPPLLRNRGTILADTVNTIIQILGGSINNEGRLAATAGTLNLSFDTYSSGSIEISGNGAIDGSSTISITDGGSVDFDLAAIDPKNGTARIRSARFGIASGNTFLKLEGGTPGMTYTLISGHPVSGTFSHVTPGYAVNYTSSVITVTVVPEPAWAISLVGPMTYAACLWRRRHR